MTTTYYPFQITREDVDRSTTLDKGDIGCWAIIINGTIQLVAEPMPVTI